jgi:nitrite reductase (NADH) large subunit
MRKQRLVVIGNGMAGASVVESVLALGGDQLAVTVFAGEPYGPYDRMRLADVMNGARPTAQLFHKDLGWYSEQGVTIHVGEHAKVVSRTSKRVYGAKGTVEAYDALVLAMGSEAYVPPIKNILGNVSGLRDKVCSFRSLEDSRIIVSHAGHARQVAILGGGVLALEAMRGLLAQGCTLRLVHSGPGLLYNQLGEAGSRALRRAVEAAGVAVHLGAAATAVVDETSVRGVALANGSSLGCDLVVLALGIQPTTWI